MDLSQLDCKFSVLDELPDSLYADVITHPHGELIQRAAGVLQWREFLLQGELPVATRLDWPEWEVRKKILMRLEVIDIARYCYQQEELADSVLKTLLEAIESAEDYLQKTQDLFNDKQAQQQKIRDDDSQFADDDGRADHVGNPAPSEPADEEQPHQEEQSNSPQSGTGDSATQQGQSEQAAAGHAEEAPDDAAETAQPPAEQADKNDTQGDTPPDSWDKAELNTPPDAPASDTNSPGDTTALAIGEMSAEQLEAQWTELAQDWHTLESVFDELGSFLGKGWDLTQGMLASQGWRDIIRYRKLVHELPQLQRLIETLGRLHETQSHDDSPPEIEQIVAPLMREEDAPQDTPDPHTIDDTDGVHRSDDLGRMLPAELAMLGHPVLNTLWHARRAEKTLATYRLKGVLSEHTPQETEDEETIEREKAVEQGHGPIIICLDTSASMQGEPENIAKAIVLEALRVAHHEQRACHVYSFGGEQQLLEHELDLSDGGNLGELLAFLQQSFHGGTDVSTPLRLALKKQREENWQRADILLVSDGRFPPDDTLKQQVERAKTRQGLRLHGVLLGNWQGSALQSLCDPLHRFSSWQTRSS